ncbi:MAG: hypothetical protein WBX01_09530 [Nitrososphaeraceae archaeon]
MSKTNFAMPICHYLVYRFATELYCTTRSTNRAGLIIFANNSNQVIVLGPGLPKYSVVFTA